MFCITLEDNHYQKIKDFGYLPVGLGTKIKNDNFLRDNTGNNISKKTLIMENILFIFGCGRIIK